MRGSSAFAFGRPNAEEILPRIADRFVGVAERTKKPFAVVLGPSDYPEEDRWRLVSDMRERLAGAGLAVYPSVERAVRALAAHTKYWQARNRGPAEA